MGYGIELIYPGSTYVHDKLSMSYNWHIFKHIFHISEIYGHRGMRVLKRLRTALAQMRELGYDNPKQLQVDSWGKTMPGEELSQDELLLQQGCMFYRKVKILLASAYENPFTYWCADDDTWHCQDLDNVAYLTRSAIIALPKSYQADMNESEVATLLELSIFATPA